MNPPIERIALIVTGILVFGIAVLMLSSPASNGIGNNNALAIGGSVSTPVCPKLTNPDECLAFGSGSSYFSPTADLAARNQALTTAYNAGKNACEADYDKCVVSETKESATLESKCQNTTGISCIFSHGPPVKENCHLIPLSTTLQLPGSSQNEGCAIYNAGQICQYGPDGVQVNPDGKVEIKSNAVGICKTASNSNINGWVCAFIGKFDVDSYSCSANAVSTPDGPTVRPGGSTPGSSGSSKPFAGGSTSGQN